MRINSSQMQHLDLWQQNTLSPVVLKKMLLLTATIQDAEKQLASTRHLHAIAYLLFDFFLSLMSCQDLTPLFAMHRYGFISI